MAKKTKRKAPTRKAPAKRVKRANAKTAAQTRKPARSASGTLAIPSKLKDALSARAKAAGFANWKRMATELIEQGMAKA